MINSMAEIKEGTNVTLPTLIDIERMHDIVAGRASAAAVYVAAKLGIADQLISSPKNCSQLAEILNVNPKALYRLMRALASIQVFTELADERFALTPMASTMRSDIPNSMRPLIIMCGSPWHWTTWGGLLDTIETGKPYFVKHFNSEFFPYAQKNPDVADEFNAAMTSLSSLSDYAIAHIYDFSSARKIVDVGGGKGSLLLSILNSNPNIQGILFDLPKAIDAAKQRISLERLEQRCMAISGDFFENVPEGGDVYIIKHVLHGIDKQQAIKIFKNIKNVIKPEGKVLIIEMVIPESNAPSYSKFNDLGMMLLSDTGQERTEAELKDILADSGFSLSRIIPIQMGICIIEAINS